MNGGMQMNRSVTMRNIRQILKLSKEDKLSNRRISESLKCSHSTVGWVLKRFDEVGLLWPLPETMTDTELENTFYPPAKEKSRKAEVDMNYIHKELKRKGVTLMLLWHEYKLASVNPLEYSQFCERYRQWHKKLDVSMHQNHKAGEKVFVDWAGMVTWITNKKTGTKTETYMFVVNDNMKMHKNYKVKVHNVVHFLLEIKISKCFAKNTLYGRGGCILYEF